MNTPAKVPHAARIPGKKRRHLRIFITLSGLIISSFAYSQGFKMTKTCLVSELIKNNGTLAIRIGYSIGKKPYNEEHIFIQKQDSILKAEFFIDNGSYFVSKRKYHWTDTLIFIQNHQFNDLIALEKELFIKGLKPTYNCDGKKGRVLHNLTSFFFAYNPDETVEINEELIDKDDYIHKVFKSEKCKYKLVNIAGGFVSMRDELLNLGVDFERHKTNWWDE